MTVLSTLSVLVTSLKCIYMNETQKRTNSIESQAMFPPLSPLLPLPTMLQEKGNLGSEIFLKLALLTSQSFAGINDSA